MRILSPLCFSSARICAVSTEIKCDGPIFGPVCPGDLEIVVGSWIQQVLIVSIVLSCRKTTRVFINVTKLILVGALLGIVVCRFVGFLVVRVCGLYKS